MRYLALILSFALCAGCESPEEKVRAAWEAEATFYEAMAMGFDAQADMFVWAAKWMYDREQWDYAQELLDTVYETRANAEEAREDANDRHRNALQERSVASGARQKALDLWDLQLAANDLVVTIVPDSIAGIPQIEEGLPSVSRNDAVQAWLRVSERAEQAAVAWERVAKLPAGNL